MNLSVLLTIAIKSLNVAFEGRLNHREVVRVMAGFGGDRRFRHSIETP